MSKVNTARRTHYSNRNTHCNTLHRTLQHTAPHCNTRQVKMKDAERERRAENKLLSVKNKELEEQVKAKDHFVTQLERRKEQILQETSAKV